ncbi:hypothetical protein AALB16_09945 [Lachnospiraceae bacterium 62-35]
MLYSKEELICQIEAARKILDKSISENARYEEIYQNSLKVDKLLEQYIEQNYQGIGIACRKGQG